MKARSKILSYAGIPPRSQARRDLGDQLNATTPDMDTEERRHLLGKYNVRIHNAKGAAEIKAIKDEFEKQIKTPKRVNPSREAAERLRGLLR
jgi:hypothetical protein